MLALKNCKLWMRAISVTLPVVIFLALGRPASANVEFQAKRMTRSDVPLGKGQCDIRLRVDGEAEITVRGDRVSIRTISGRDARDDGSECNEPMPARALTGFNFDVLDKRNEIRLLSGPDRPTGYSAVVRIRDSDGGEGRYHFRLSWQMDGGGQGPGYGRPGGGYGNGDGRGIDNNNDRWGGGSRFPFSRAISVCTDAVRDRINRDYRFSNADIGNTRVDDRPGRNDWVLGDAAARDDRGSRYSTQFTFSCQVDFSSGRVRSVDVRRR